MRYLKIAGGLVVIVAGLLVLNRCQPDRLTPERLKEAREMQAKLDAEAAAAKPAADKEDAVAEKPDANAFKVKFETTAGDFVVEVHRDWAPIGAKRFEELVTAKYYDGNRFFRVLPGFVVQFGLNGDPKVAAEWERKRLKDDPVLMSNEAGTLTFATAGPHTRTTQLFINLANNARLDQMGFSPFAKVVEGFEVVQKINSEYGERPDQGRIKTQGNAYLEKSFPRLDYIKTAHIVE